MPTTADIINDISGQTNLLIRDISGYIDISFNTDTRVNKENKYYGFKGRVDLIQNTLKSIYATDSNKNTLQDIGRYQQQNIALKSTLKTKKEELALAEARLDSITTRYEKPSYAQTIGGILRPFRKISYLIIVPLIFLMILTSFWLLRPGSVAKIASLKLPGMTSSSNIFKFASAPSINSNFNKEIAQLAKLR